MESLSEYYHLGTTVRISSFGALNITVNYPELLPQPRLKQKTKLDGRGHEIFSQKVSGT